MDDEEFITHEQFIALLESLVKTIEANANTPAEAAQIVRNAMTANNE